MTVEILSNEEHRTLTRMIHELNGQITCPVDKCHLALVPLLSLCACSAFMTSQCLHFLQKVFVTFSLKAAHYLDHREQRVEVVMGKVLLRLGGLVPVL